VRAAATLRCTSAKRLWPPEAALNAYEPWFPTHHLQDQLAGVDAGQHGLTAPPQVGQAGWVGDGVDAGVRVVPQRRRLARPCPSGPAPPPGAGAPRPSAATPASRRGRLALSLESRVITLTPPPSHPQVTGNPSLWNTSLHQSERVACTCPSFRRWHGRSDLSCLQACRKSCASAASAARSQLRIVVIEGAEPCLTDWNLDEDAESFDLGSDELPIPVGPVPHDKHNLGAASGFPSCR